MTVRELLDYLAAADPELRLAITNDVGEVVDTDPEVVIDEAAGLVVIG